MLHKVTQSDRASIVRTLGLQRILFHFVAEGMYRLSPEILTHHGTSHRNNTAGRAGYRFLSTLYSR